MTSGSGARRPRPLVIGIPIVIAYSIFIGGTPAGELLGVLRALTALIAGVMVWGYLRSLQRGDDRIDRAMVGALVCFALASLLSTSPRQSLDAALGCLAYVSALAIARGVFRNPAVRSVTGRSLLLLSIAVAGLLGIRQAAAVVEFLSLTGWSVFPPLGLRIDAQPWGHPYDVALLGVMLYPSWFLGRPSRTRIAAAAVVGCVLAASIFFMGSRTLWAAAAGGLLIWAMPLIGNRWRAWGWRAAAVGIGSVALLVGLVLVAAPSVLDRAFNLVTLGQRERLWLATIDAWMAHPITGSGPGSFPWVLQPTGYFEFNTLAPRHPDSAIFQLLPEAGILGVVAAAAILVVLVPRLWRRRSSAARFALGTFVVASLGSNPTDFPYLVVAALIWAALASPRARVAPPVIAPRARAISFASLGSLAAISLAVTSTSVAGVYYDVAGRFAESGQLDRAEQLLDVAVALDPGMGLYWRQRGTVDLLQREPETAVSALRAATAINPSDDLAWRTLAMAFSDAGRSSDARMALDRATAVQRSDPTNLLLAAAWTASTAPAEADLAELVQAWPTLVSAQSWTTVASEASVTLRVVDLAVARREVDRPSLEPRNTQGHWLALLTARGDLLSEAIEKSDDPALAEAEMRLAQCGESAEAAVRSLPRAYERSSEYWAMVVQLAAEGGELDERALRLYSLIAAVQVPADAWRVSLNPLHENDTRGYSADRWGYRRLAIQWPDYRLKLPSPAGGSLRWMLDPAGARRQSHVTPVSEC